jgi:hypothetical protein
MRGRAVPGSAPRRIPAKSASACEGGHRRRAPTVGGCTRGRVPGLSLIVVIILGGTAVACVGRGAGADAPGRPGAHATAPVTLPPLNVDRHVVPLEQIYFDTFGGRPVPLSEASEQLIERLRDAIPPIDRPRYGGAEAADWLDEDDLVLGYVAGDGGPYAYPLKILNYHEIVNEEFDGLPVLISYCPLCRSGIVYDRRLGERALTFGNTSALYESDLVMYDRETNSYWWQVAGLAIVGELAGQRLEPLPSTTMPWGEWRRLHPDTRVLTRETGYDRPYERDPFQGLPEILDSGRTPFPTSDATRDGRLPPSEVVLGVEVGDSQAVYPLGQLGDAAVNDTVSGTRIVVFSSASGPAGAAFLTQAEGRALTFDHGRDGYRDRESGSTWDLSGRAIAGPLEGTQLTPLATRITFWYAYVAAFPSAELRR